MTKWFIGVYGGEIQLLYGDALRREFLHACEEWEKAHKYDRLARIYIEVQGDYTISTNMHLRSIPDSDFAIVDDSFTIKALELMEES